MSVTEMDVPQLNILEQLKVQHAQFIQQKEIAQNNLNQFMGAIYACEMMIKKYKEEAKFQSEENQGNGKIEVSYES